MKKKILSLIFAICLILPFAVIFTACDNKPDPIMHTVTFVYGNGTDNSTIEVEEGKFITKPTDPSNVGYNFDGWYLGEEKWAFTLIPVTQDIELTAHWIAVDYTITYELDDGTNNVGNPLTFTIEDEIELLTPIKSQYYHFAGWFTDSEYKNPITTITVGTTANLTLWAKWEQIYTWNGTTITGLTDYGKTLKSLTIPNDVTVIGESAFENCNKFTSITLSSSLTTIGEKAFYSCTALQSISIPENVESLGFAAFKYCSALTSVTFSSKCKITEINTSVFENTGLTSIIVPKSITKIGAGAFGGCTNLETVTFENGSALTTIVASAFGGCTKLSSLTLPASVTSIGASAFYNCSSLTTVIINSTNITFDENDFAFNNCTALTYLRLKAKYADVTNKDKILKNCPNLMGVIFEDYAETLKSSNLISYDIVADHYGCSTSQYPNDTYFVLPEKYEFTSGELINVPTKLQRGSFEDSNFEVIDISYVTQLGYDSFVNNSKLRIIILGKNVTFFDMNGCINNNPNLEYIIYKGTKSELQNKENYWGFVTNCPNLKAIICTDGEIPLTNPE